MDENKKKTIILGVDPGTIVTGFGFISSFGSKLQTLDFGSIKPPQKMPLSDRYWIIFSSLVNLIEKYKPTTVVVETQYVGKNVQSAMKLGMARGTALIAAKQKGLPVFEYSPTQAKLAVVGSGRASKTQVQQMVQTILSLKSIPEPEDAADALALAICHYHRCKTGAIL